MGVQPRAFSVTDEMTKSPAMTSATSPASRKRRFVDVVLATSEDKKIVAEEAADEAELTERVSFKRAKSSVNEMRVVVHNTSSHRVIASPSRSLDAPKAKLSPSKARPNMSASQTITLDMLRPHFEKPLAQVAQIFSICVTLLKKICRKNGLARWPHRQIIGLRKSISSMEQAIGHFEGPRRESYAQQLEKQRNKLAALLEDPTRGNLLAVEDDYTPPITPTLENVPVHTYQHPPTQPMYAQYAPQLTYNRSNYASYPQPEYTAPPRMYQQPAYHEAYPPYGGFAPPHSYGFQPPHPQAFPQRSPPSSVSLPPLRIENRPTLPSLSTVVGRRW